MEVERKLKDTRKKSKFTLVMTYLVIWASMVIVFWVFGSMDPMGFSISSFIVLTVSTFIISFFIGKDKGWSSNKWFLIVFFGVMSILFEYATFSLAIIKHINSRKVI